MRGHWARYGGAVSREAVASANVSVVPPEGIPVSPILEIAPFQHLAVHLAVARQSNPDAPRGLRKVTETL